MKDWFGRWHIGARLQTVTAVTFMAFAALLVAIQIMESQRLVEARVALLRTIDETASGIAGAFQTEEAEGRLTRQAAQEQAAEAIRAMRYQGSE